MFGFQIAFGFRCSACDPPLNVRLCFFRFQRITFNGLHKYLGLQVGDITSLNRGLITNQTQNPSTEEIEWRQSWKFATENFQLTPGLSDVKIQAFDKNDNLVEEDCRHNPGLLLLIKGSISFSTFDAETGVDKKYQEITNGGYVCQLQVLKKCFIKRGLTLWYLNTGYSNHLNTELVWYSNG